MKKTILILIMLVVVFAACGTQNNNDIHGYNDTVIRWSDQLESNAQTPIPSEETIDETQSTVAPENDRPLSSDVSEKSDSVIVADPQNTVVYITDSGEKYHKDGCSSLLKSKNEISLNDAIAKGYDPCKKCFAK